MADNITESRTSLLKSLEHQLLKQHIVLDSQGRPQFIFEAPVDTADGGPCLVTEYVYVNPTESVVMARQERHYRWKAIWDTNFTFDNTVAYDADGDGSI